MNLRFAICDLHQLMRRDGSPPKKRIVMRIDITPEEDASRPGHPAAQLALSKWQKNQKGKNRRATRKTTGHQNLTTRKKTTTQEQMVMKNGQQICDQRRRIGHDSQYEVINQHFSQYLMWMSSTHTEPNITEAGRCGNSDTDGVAARNPPLQRLNASTSQ